MEHRLRIDRSGPFCIGFLTHRGGYGPANPTQTGLAGADSCYRCHRSDRLLAHLKPVFLDFAVQRGNADAQFVGGLLLVLVA